MPSACPIKLPYRAHWNINNCCNVIIPLACNGGLRQLGNKVRQWRHRRFQRASILSKLFTEPFNIFGDHGLNRSWQAISFFTPASAPSWSSTTPGKFDGTRERKLAQKFSHNSNRFFHILVLATLACNYLQLLLFSKMHNYSGPWC